MLCGDRDGAHSQTISPNPFAPNFFILRAAREEMINRNFRGRGSGRAIIFSRDVEIFIFWFLSVQLGSESDQRFAFKKFFQERAPPRALGSNDIDIKHDYCYCACCMRIKPSIHKDQTTERIAIPLRRAVILLSVSCLKMAQAEGHKQVSSANADCSVKCLNGGYCSFTKYTDYPQKGDVGYYPSCVCRPGFGGSSCENTVDECQPPYFKCHNGAPCKREETSGSLSCDCSFADDKSVLAGYMCRNPVTQACETLDENDNNKSFCTNGGVCLSSLKTPSKELVFSEPTV